METEKEYPAFDKQFEKIDIALEALDGLKEKLGLEHYFKFDYELSILKELVQHTHDSLPFKVGDYVKAEISDPYWKDRLEDDVVLQLAGLSFNRANKRNDTPAGWLAQTRLVYHDHTYAFSIGRYLDDDVECRPRFRQQDTYLWTSISELEPATQTEYLDWIHRDQEEALKRYNEHRDEIFSKQRQCKSCGRSCTCGGK